jgi:predicted AlkP superfamily phosphohydrolase/phosphomutase
MSSTNGRKVLAIGLDAAEPSLIRQLMKQGLMPGLVELANEGCWVRVQAPAYIGSGSVWPTFMTGTPPTVHGRYSEWIWRPATMGLERYHGRDLVPFWKKLDERGFPVGVLDVPFATPVGLEKGFEVAEWWAHDSVLGGTQSGPENIGALLKELPPHPLSLKRQDAVRPNDPVGLRQLAADSTEGVRRRGVLAQRLIDQTQPALVLVVFPETHHAGHQMWHTAASDHALYRNQGFTSEPLLNDVYREIDRQIAKLAANSPKDTTVLVFSLHGMKAAFGSPAFLPQLLCARGFSQITNWSSQSWSERRRSLLAGLKNRAPLSVRQFYYKFAPAAAIQQIARPTMLPIYNWRKTRAFSLPTDQYGWIRINLEGREAQGSVPLARYNETQDDLESMLRQLKDHNGELLVREVVRTVTNGAETLSHQIPDLVVHWNDAAFAPGLRIENTDFESRPVGIKTGQHSLDGFCVIKGRAKIDLGTSILAEDMGSLIGKLLVGL